jgi:hypothetical protein
MPVQGADNRNAKPKKMGGYSVIYVFLPNFFFAAFWLLASTLRIIL